MFHAGITDTFIEPERFYPGAHVFFVGSCRDVCLFEDAGFELRDCVFDFGGGLLWWLLRRPVVGTVAANVLAFGVGAINIDGSRIGFASAADQASATPQGKVTSNSRAGAAPDVDGGERKEIDRPDNSKGRWPANIILDPYTAQLLDEQSGILKSGVTNPQTASMADNVYQSGYAANSVNFFPASMGGASRFFYVAQQPQDLIEYLTNLILPPNGKLFFNLKEQETHDR